MPKNENILKRIKACVISAYRDSEVILFGSFARGEQNDDSDLDILIIVDREALSLDEERKITCPL
jgi:predicted nucleotidyltransferase